jgi:hypothetical protein
MREKCPTPPETRGKCIHNLSTGTVRIPDRPLSLIGSGHDHPVLQTTLRFDAV